MSARRTDFRYEMHEITNVSWSEFTSFWEKAKSNCKETVPLARNKELLTKIANHVKRHPNELIKVGRQQFRVEIKPKSNQIIFYKIPAHTSCLSITATEIGCYIERNEFFDKDKVIINFFNTLLSPTAPPSNVKEEKTPIPIGSGPRVVSDSASEGPLHFAHLKEKRTQHPEAPSPTAKKYKRGEDGKVSPKEGLRELTPLSEFLTSSIASPSVFSRRSRVRPPEVLLPPSFSSLSLDPSDVPDLSDISGFVPSIPASIPDPMKTPSVIERSAEGSQTTSSMHAIVKNLGKGFARRRRVRPPEVILPPEFLEATAEAEIPAPIAPSIPLRAATAEAEIPAPIAPSIPLRAATAEAKAPAETPTELTVTRLIAPPAPSLPLGNTFETALASDYLIDLIKQNEPEAAQARFANIFYTRAKLISPTCYRQHINWTTAAGKVFPVFVDLQLTNHFYIKDTAPPGIPPSSWLFDDNFVPKNPRETLPHFNQINPAYVIPTADPLVPKYFTFTIYEKDNITPLAYVFASRCGHAVELVNLKKGTLSGKEVFDIASTYIFGLFPHAKPVFADMSYQPGAPEKDKIILRLIKAIIEGKTYYESIAKVTLAEGNFTTHPYGSPISQNKEQRKAALNKLQNFSLKDWYKILGKKKSELTALYRNLFSPESIEREAKTEEKEIDFGEMNLQTFVTLIYKSQKPEAQSALMNLLAMDLDLWGEPDRMALTKSKRDQFKGWITELTWGSLIWTIDRPNPKASQEAKTMLRA